MLALNLGRAAIEQEAAVLLTAQQAQRNEDEKVLKALARTRAAVVKAAQKAAVRAVKTA